MAALRFTTTLVAAAALLSVACEDLDGLAVEEAETSATTNPTTTTTTDEKAAPLTTPSIPAEAVRNIDPTACAKVSLASKSAYVSGYRAGDSNLKYEIASLALGEKLRPGKYTIAANRLDGLLRLVDATGKTIVSTKYDWTTIVHTQKPVGLMLGEHLAISIICRGSASNACSMSLYDLQTLFDGKRPLEVVCDQVASR